MKRPSRQKIEIPPGSMYAIPLRDASKWGVGLVSWSSGRGPMQIALFDRFFDYLPDQVTVEQFDRNDAFLVLTAGDLGILEGSWPLVGRIKDFSEEEWVFHTFRYNDFDGTRPARICVVADLENGYGKATAVDATLEQTRAFPSYESYPDGAVEIVLTAHCENPKRVLPASMDPRPYAGGRLPT